MYKVCVFFFFKLYDLRNKILSAPHMHTYTTTLSRTAFPPSVLSVSVRVSHTAPIVQYAAVKAAKYIDFTKSSQLFYQSVTLLVLGIVCPLPLSLSSRLKCEAPPPPSDCVMITADTVYSAVVYTLLSSSVTHL